jgi:hypothetical protein
MQYLVRQRDRQPRQHIVSLPFLHLRPAAEFLERSGQQLLTTAVCTASFSANQLPLPISDSALNCPSWFLC